MEKDAESRFDVFGNILAQVLALSPLHKGALECPPDLAERLRRRSSLEMVTTSLCQQGAGHRLRGAAINDWLSQSTALSTNLGGQGCAVHEMAGSELKSRCVSRLASAAAMNSRNTRGPAYGRNRGRGLLAPHRAGCPGPAVLLPVPGGLFHSEPDVRIKGPGRLLLASDDKYCPVPPGGPGAQGRGQTWARLLEGDIHPGHRQPTRGGRRNSRPRAEYCAADQTENNRSE